MDPELVEFSSIVGMIFCVLLGVLCTALIFETVAHEKAKKRKEDLAYSRDNFRDRWHTSEREATRLREQVHGLTNERDAALQRLAAAEKKLGINVDDDDEA